MVNYGYGVWKLYEIHVRCTYNKGVVYEEILRFIMIPPTPFWDFCQESTLENYFLVLSIRSVFWTVLSKRFSSPFLLSRILRHPYKPSIYKSHPNGPNTLTWRELAKISLKPPKSGDFPCLFSNSFLHAIYIMYARTLLYIGKGICSPRTKKLGGGLLYLRSTLLNAHHTLLNVRSTVLNVRHTVCDRDSEASPKHQIGDSVDFT